MNILVRLCVLTLFVFAARNSMALSLAPEEFQASRQMACVLAQQSLGQLSETEYGNKAHSLLDGFDETERDNILAQAIGYFGGIMFTTDEGNADGKALKLETFVASRACSNDFRQVTHSL